MPSLNPLSDKLLESAGRQKPMVIDLARRGASTVSMLTYNEFQMAAVIFTLVTSKCSEKQEAWPPNKFSCNLTSKPRNRAFEAYYWNMHKSTQELNQWEIFEKITEYLNYDLFWGQKWPGNWASEANIQHTSKSSSNWLVRQDWCETSGKCMRKWPKIRIFTYFWAESGPKIVPLRSIFSSHLKVLAISMWRNTDVKPVKAFWESDQTSELWLTLGPKMAQKLGLLGTYCIYC